jgi:hypothetical protein
MYNVIKNFTLSMPIAIFILAFAGISDSLAAPADEPVPNLVGTWTGENNTYSDKKGHLSWTKTIEIVEQKGRIFKGQFTYSAGTKHFFGVIYPDNASFTWVADDSQGYNHGHIHSKDKISACYVEAGAEATVGCAELTKQHKP